MFLVTGATGGVGRHVVDELLAAGQQVRALSRDPAAADLPDGVEVAHVADPPLAGVTAIFLNPVMFWASGPDGFLSRAKDQGVRRIVLLSSASTLYPDAGNPIGEHHLRIERPIEDLGFEWTFLRPGAFATNALQWAQSIRTEHVVRQANGQAQTAPIHEHDMADIATRALLTDDLLGAKPWLSGPESLTMVQQVELISAAIGAPIRFEELTHEAARAAMLQSGRMTEEVADSLLNMFARMVDRPADLSPEYERITGTPGRTFAQWAADHATTFK